MTAETHAADAGAGAASAPMSIAVVLAVTGRQSVAGVLRLTLAAGDEVIVACCKRTHSRSHNVLPRGWRRIAVPGERSAARARNAGAAAATADRLLFLAPGCSAPADLLERFRTGSPPPRLAPQLIIAGGGWLLVPRRVWRELGGFLEGIRTSEDIDLLRRAHGAGIEVTERHEPVLHRSRNGPLTDFRRAYDDAAATVWLRRRWPDQADPEPALVGRWAGTLGRAVGRWAPNRARQGRVGSSRGTRVPVQLWCDQFPVVSETFVVNEIRALRECGHEVEVRSVTRPLRPALGIHDIRARYLEDETRLERIVALAGLALLRPRLVWCDRRDRPRWAGDEEPLGLRALGPAALGLMRRRRSHVHVHFAKGAALCALRVSRLAGCSWSLTAHAYDIYKEPANLVEKVRTADLVTSGCEYTVRDLREIAGPDRADRVHEIVMGVDPARFRRSRAHPDSRTVVAIGRLVEKKGFADLVIAAADERLTGLLDRVVIIGEGPLLSELRALCQRLRVTERVVMAGRMEPDEIRDELERAAVLAMPCVVAPDGDRDSMPVVVKEAAAMEIPVVVTDEVGLPELVRPSFGRIVPPSDPSALAAALAELLALPLEQRIAMGRAGRAHIERHANVAIETAKLSELIAQAT